VVRILARRTVAAIAALVVVAGCSDDARPKSATATSFADGVCAAVSEWGDHIVEAANAFTDDSARLNDSGRRARYLFAFDEQGRITERLREELQAAPPNGVGDAATIRAELLHAVDDVVQNIHDQKADAAEHVDFHFLGPKPDRLFAGTEKSLSLMLKPLDEAARQHDENGLGGACGRG
jgi:hypothetical protein